MRLRVVLNGNVLTVVDGEPQDSTEINREVAEQYINLGILEVMPEGPPEAGGDVATPPKPRRK